MKKNLLSLLFLSLIALSSAFAQSRKITGIVTASEDGQPIPGVSVKVQGSTIGTQTSVDGKFSLSVPSGTPALDVTFVGYAVQHVKLTGASYYAIVLSADTRQLSEVVVTDTYGVQSKKSYTGSATTVSSDDIKDKPFPSVLQSLQGQVAGLNSSNSSGAPGANQQIRIRGIGSIYAGSNPLYVIDGNFVNSGDLSRLSTSTNALAGLNEDDIESITVLKDASATAIYGSRGSNGVVVITTKKGKSGKAQVEADVQAGNTYNLAIPDAGRPLNGADFSTLFIEGLNNSGYSSAQVQSFITSYGLNGPSNDWYNLVTRNGKQQQYNVSVRGGSETTQLFVSGGYFTQEATVIGSDLTRVTALMNLSQKVGQRITISSNLNFSNQQQNSPSNGGAFASPVLSAYFLRPEQLAYNADGSLNFSRAGNTNFTGVYNPLYMVQNDKKFDTENKLVGNVQAKWNIITDLNFTSFVGVDYTTLEEQQYNNPIMGDGRTSGGRGYDYYTRYYNWITRNQLDYRYNIGGSSDFYAEASVGYEAQKSTGYLLSTNTNQYPAAEPGLIYSINASTPVLGNASGTGYSFNSIYSRGSINYHNKYTLGGSFRRDGSSKFGLNNPYANFYSVSGAWNIDQETFFAKQKYVSSAKLRTSYGTIGNAAIGNYDALPQASYNNNYAGSPGQSYNILGSPDLTWESSKQFDAGLDLGFLHDRLDFSIDYYNRNISGLIQAAPISRVTGFTTALLNIGSMTNKGWEFTIKGTPVKTKDFSWFSSINLALNKNTITSLYNSSQIIDGSFLVKEGMDYRTWYLRAYAGVNPANGDALWYTDNTYTATTNNYNAAARVASRQADPKGFGGFSNTFTFKGITLSGDFYYNFGNWIQDTWANYLNDGYNLPYNKYSYNLKRWQNPGDITDVPKFTLNTTNSYSSSTRFLYKGDYIRLKNVSVGYDLTRGVSALKKYGINKLYLYGRGSNLWTKTFDSRLPFDPEQGVNGQSNLEIPQVRTFTLGLNIGL